MLVLALILPTTGLVHQLVVVLVECLVVVLVVKQVELLVVEQAVPVAPIAAAPMMVGQVELVEPIVVGQAEPVAPIVVAQAELVEPIAALRAELAEPIVVKFGSRVLERLQLPVVGLQRELRVQHLQQLLLLVEKGSPFAVGLKRLLMACRLLFGTDE